MTTRLEDEWIEDDDPDGWDWDNEEDPPEDDRPWTDEDEAALYVMEQRKRERIALELENDDLYNPDGSWKED